jgi:uncharacterized membrane protein
METFVYYVFIFYIYSFIGWAQEVIQSIFKFKKFINRGFLIGPICPVYGFGSIMITYFLKDYIEQPFFVFLTAIFICCTLEYFTSYILEKIFKARWWDYSQMKFNINGRICLECGLGFGLGAMAILYVINPYIIDPIFNKCDIEALTIITFIVLILQAIDTIISFRFISKLKNISNSIKSDNTEVITREVKRMLEASTLPYRRLLESFPDMQINNKLSIIKTKLEEQKKKYLKYIERNKRKYKLAKKKVKESRKHM